MPTFLSVSEAARRLGVRPKDISDAFYQRRLRDDLCPIIAGRRLIPDDYLEQIAHTLKLSRTLKNAMEPGDDNP